MKPILYIDYDSTLVNFILAWEFLILKNHNKLNVKLEDYMEFGSLSKLLKEHNGENIDLYNSSCEVTKGFIKDNNLYDLIKFGDFYEHVPLFEGAFEFLAELASHYEIKIVTSSMSSDQKKFKSFHIEKFFPGLISEVIPARKKQPKTTDGSFMDDKFSAVKEHVLTNKRLGILFNFGGQLDNKKHRKEIEELKKSHPENFYEATTFEEVLTLFQGRVKKKAKKIDQTNQKSTQSPKFN